MVKEDFIPDCLFPTDNTAEIPVLLMEGQPEFCQCPFVCFGEQKRTFKMNGAGTLHFYTDDYRFNALFERPESILHHDPACIVEPNYSLFFDTPVAFGLQYIYKKRFIARAMQERGIKVLVDLNVSPKFYQLNFLGVPKGWRSYCTRGYSDRLASLEKEYEMAQKHADGNRLLFVIYGGGQECQRFAAKHGCVYITPHVRFVDKAKRQKAYEQTMSFFGHDMTNLEFASFMEMEAV